LLSFRLVKVQIAHRLWKGLTEAIAAKDMDAATEAKTLVEEAQREERKKRDESGEKHVPRFFVLQDGLWVPKFSYGPFPPHHPFTHSTPLQHPTGTNEGGCRGGPEVDLATSTAISCLSLPRLIIVTYKNPHINAIYFSPVYKFMTSGTSRRMWRGRGGTGMDGCSSVNDPNNKKQIVPGKHNHTSTTRSIMGISSARRLRYIQSIVDDPGRCRGVGEIFYDHQPSASTLGATETTLFAGDGERNDEPYRA
jgi:hypothetical protein